MSHEESVTIGPGDVGMLTVTPPAAVPGLEFLIARQNRLLERMGKYVAQLQRLQGLYGGCAAELAVVRAAMADPIEAAAAALGKPVPKLGDVKIDVPTGTLAAHSEG